MKTEVFWDMTPHKLVNTGISEKFAASIFTVQDVRALRTSWILNTEAANYSQMSTMQQGLDVIL
jgi:hypothetical protein